MAQRGIVKNGLSADIAAEHHAALFSTMYGKSGICSGFNELACTKVDNNTVRLASGVYSLSGYALMVDPGTTEDLTIDSGTSGQNRNDLVVAEFVRNGGGLGVDTLHFTVVKGTSTSGTAADPALTQQDINAAGVTRQEALYRVKVVGTEITAVEKVAGSVSNLNLVELNLWKTIYPVGCLFETTDSAFNPQTHFGGTWEQYGAGRVTVGYSSGETEFNSGGKTGGAKTHTLTEAQMPSHNHSIPALSGTAASAGSHKHSYNGSQSPWNGGGSANSLYFGSIPATNENYAHAIQNDGAHTHNVSTVANTTGAKGSGSTHNNLQPYITVFRWTRTG